METRKILTILVLGLAIMVCSAEVSEAAEMGTAFTYQGHLYDNNDVANGLYDFQFSLYADPCVGSPIGSDINEPNVDVIDGYFTVELDFGSSAFSGLARWLQIGVRPGEQNDPCVYTALVPRQEITPTPYALYAKTTGSVPVPLNLTGNTMMLGEAIMSATNTGGGEGVRGVSENETGVSGEGGNIGVEGSSFAGTGVIGHSDSGRGVEGWSTSGYAGYFTSSSGYGLIVESGNVGIGTTSPSTKLDVVGTVNATAFVGDGSGLTNLPAGTDGDWTISGSDIYLTVAGNVGIGTTSPGEKLEVSLGAGSGSIASFSAFNTNRFLISVDGSDTDLSAQSGNNLKLGTSFSGTSLTVLNSTGNVGIGTTGPGDKLDVAGHINSSETYKLDGDTVLANTGTNNIFAGEGAGASITSGYGNSAMGYQVLYSNTTGYYNSAMGYNALYSNTTGRLNSAVGYEALFSNTTGLYNSAMGYEALRSNITGAGNSAVGYQALKSNSAGYRNSAMGYDALLSNTTGDDNSAVGYNALRSTTGGSNSAMGSYALRNNTTGNYNTAMGYEALYSKTTGNANLAVGYGAGRNNSTGIGNVFLGYMAGYNETGSNKLYIDSSSTSTPLIYGDFATDRVGIARVPTTNTFEVEGNASKTTASGWAANSDERIKADIQTVTGALETLDKVRLVSFKYTDDYQAKHPSIEKRRYLNVIAQEFRQVFPEYVKSSKEKLTNGEEILQVDAYPLTVYSAAAVQELHAIVKEKDAEITGLKERISRIETVLVKLVHEQEGAMK